MVAGFPASRPRRMGERRFFPAGQSGTAENLSGLKNLSTVMAPQRADFRTHSPRNPSVTEIGVQLIARWDGMAAEVGLLTRWVQNC